MRKSVKLLSRNHLPASGTNTFDAVGMSLIEVLIAIALFSVFAGIFVAVIEMLSIFIPSSVPSAVSNPSCDESAGLELACINLALDEIQPLLEEASSVSANVPEIFLSKCYPSPAQIPIPGLATISSIWPMAYEVCIFNYPGLPEQSGRPGLYLLQAQPKRGAGASVLQVPVQRLFCRPYHRCVKP